jgi:flagellar basal-body rod protein FlgB
MDNSTAILVIKALDGLAARAVVTAENIANAGTPGYRPLRVNFEGALKDAATRGDDAVRQVALDAERTATAASEGELRVDLEMATASATALRYGALIEVLNRQGQLKSLAITGSP